MSANLLIKQGHCYLANMNPSHKTKPGKVRPVVVIQSTDTLEAGSPSVVIVPCTSQIKEENILRGHLKIQPGLKLKQPSDILIDQIHTLDRTLIIEELGELPKNVWNKIKQGISFLLTNSITEEDL